MLWSTKHQRVLTGAELCASLVLPARGPYATDRNLIGHTQVYIAILAVLRLKHTLWLSYGPPDPGYPMDPLTPEICSIQGKGCESSFGPARRPARRQSQASDRKWDECSVRRSACFVGGAVCRKEKLKAGRWSRPSFIVCTVHAGPATINSKKFKKCFVPTSG